MLSEDRDYQNFQRKILRPNFSAPDGEKGTYFRVNEQLLPFGEVNKSLQKLRPLFIIMRVSSL